MKIETDHDTKKLLKNLVAHVLKVGVNVSRMKAFMRCLRYDYWEYHSNYLNSLVSDFARADFISRMGNVTNYYTTLSYSLKILTDVLKQYSIHTNFAHANNLNLKLWRQWEFYQFQWRSFRNYYLKPESVIQIEPDFFNDLPNWEFGSGWQEKSY